MKDLNQDFDELWGEAPHGTLKYIKGEEIKAFIREREAQAREEGYTQGRNDENQQIAPVYERLIREEKLEARKEEREAIIHWAIKKIDEKKLSNGYFNAMKDLIKSLNVK